MRRALLTRSSGARGVGEGDGCVLSRRALVDRGGHCRRLGRGHGRRFCGGSGSSGGWEIAVQAETVFSAALLGALSRAGDAAVGEGRRDAAVVDGISAVALAAGLDAKVLEARAGSGALSDRHLVIEVGGAGKSPGIVVIGVASHRLVAGAPGRRTALRCRRWKRRGIDA